MMCESVAEFDPNVNPMAPEVPGVTEEQNAAQANEVVKQELAVNPVYCPLAATAAKLGPLYDEVHSLLTNRLTFDDKEEMVRQLEYVSELATKVADVMRMCLVKTNALFRYVDRAQYYMEPVHEYGGFFLRKLPQLNQDGYDTINTTIERLPELSVYAVRSKLLTDMCMDDKLPMTPTDILNTICWGHETIRFSSTIDFMDCFFHDPERMNRLEKSETRSFEIDRLVRDSGDSCDYVRTGSGGPSFEATMISWMASVLKAIKMNCYDMQCELMDPGCRIDMGNSSYLSKLHSAVVNLFCYPAVYIIAEAFEIKCCMTSYQAIRDGVNEILTHYGVKPGK